LRYQLFLIIFVASVGAIGLPFQTVGQAMAEAKTNAQTADLARCYQLAVTSSEALGVREAEVRAAEARYWQAVSAVLPKVNLRFNERLQNNAGSGSSADTGEAFNTGPGLSRGSRNAFDGRITVSQTIFNGFRDFKRMGVRRDETNANRFTATRARQLLYLDVADVFYQILSLQEDLGVLRLLEQALQERTEELEKRVRLGRSRRADLLSAQSELASARVTVEQVKGLEAAASELMAFLTNVPSGRLVFKESQPFPQPAELRAYLNQVLARPDVQASEALVGAAEQELSATRSERWPEINFEGNAFFVEQPGSDRVWNFFITFNLPIFDGFVTEARVRERKEQVQISRLNLEALRRQADSEIRTAFLTYWSNVAQRERLREAVRLTRDNYLAQKEDYELGRASNLDVLVALVNLQRLRREEIGAEMQARASFIELHVASGKGSS
jgi:outer membrane protein